MGSFSYWDPEVADDFAALQSERLVDGTISSSSNVLFVLTIISTCLALLGGIVFVAWRVSKSNARDEEDDDRDRWRGRGNSTSRDRDDEKPSASAGLAFAPFPTTVGPRPPRHRALLIGILYRRTANELQGCEHDVENSEMALINQYHYLPENIRMLTEHRGERPTKQNMLKAFQWFVSDLRPGDHLYFHFSGHGTTEADLHGDHGVDACIVPLDYDRNGLIRDYQLHKCLVDPVMQANAQLFAMFDCCHSGTVMDLRHSYECNNRMEIVEEISNHEDSSARIIVLSGCEDQQVSEDIVDDAGNSYGALSHEFFRVLKRYNYNIAFGQLLCQITDNLRKAKIGQTPQLSCPGPLDMSLRVVI